MGEASLMGMAARKVVDMVAERVAGMVIAPGAVVTLVSSSFDSVARHSRN